MRKLASALSGASRQTAESLSASREVGRSLWEVQVGKGACGEYTRALTRALTCLCFQHTAGEAVEIGRTLFPAVAM